MAHGSKGRLSSKEYNRLSNLVKQGKAMWWMRRYDSIELAIAAAGL